MGWLEDNDFCQELPMADRAASSFGYGFGNLRNEPWNNAHNPRLTIRISSEYKPSHSPSDSDCPITRNQCEHAFDFESWGTYVNI